MGHSSPSTQSILSSFHSNGSTASAVSQMGSSSFNSKNETQSSFSSSATSKNKSIATFNVTPTSTQMGKTFVAINKMATTSPESFQRNATTFNSSRTASFRSDSSLSLTPSKYFNSSNSSSSKTPPTLSNPTVTSPDPFRTPTPSQRAIYPVSPINASSMRRQPTSKLESKILVQSSAPSVLDRKPIAATESQSFGYTTPKSVAPLACLSFNAPLIARRPNRAPINRRIINDDIYGCTQTTPSNKMNLRNTDDHLLTSRRPMQPRKLEFQCFPNFKCTKIMDTLNG